MVDSVEKLNNDFIILGEGGGWLNPLFDDVTDHEHFAIGNNPFCPCWDNRLFNMVCKLIWGPKFGDPNNSGMVARWLMKIICKRIKKRFPNGGICICHRSSPLSQNVCFLQKMRAINPELKMVYWFTDVVKLVEINIPDVLKICRNFFDLIVTYEKEDALKYSFSYLETPYSFLSDNVDNNGDKTIDLFYVGKAKIDVDITRYKKIIKIFELAKANNLKTEFHIIDVPLENQVHNNDIAYNVPLPYSSVKEKIKHSKCILEVSQIDEKGTTLRLFEAIAFDTKLLFTNNNLISHDYYDGKYMKYVNCDDTDNISINFDFIKNDESVKYENKQKEQLSPTIFLNTVDHLLKEGGNNNG